jgi:hypothetical protein
LERDTSGVRQWTSALERMHQLSAMMWRVQIMDTFVARSEAFGLKNLLDKPEGSRDGIRSRNTTSEGSRLRS